MKKSKFLILSIALILVSTFALSGCTKVSAEEFLIELSASNEFEITSTISIKETIMGVAMEVDMTAKVSKYKDNTHIIVSGKYTTGALNVDINSEVYLIQDKKSGYTEVYYKILTDWKYDKFKSVDLEDLLGDLIDLDINSEMITVDINVAEILQTTNKAFEEVYVEEDGVWYLKKADGTADKETMKIYFEKKTLVIEMIEEKLKTTYKSGSKKITVSKEALASKKQPQEIN